MNLEILSSSNQNQTMFCVFCGNYIKNRKMIIQESIKCKCDDSHTLFVIYRDFIESIPRSFDGDSFNDCVIHKDFLHVDVRKYLCIIILFSMTYKKEYHNQINDDLIREILHYL